MDVSAIGSSLLAQSAHRLPEAVEVKTAGGDNDGDSADRSANTVKDPAPATNLNGQKLGQTINVTA